MSDYLDPVQEVLGGGKPSIARATVSIAPRTVGDDLVVTLVGYSSEHAYRIPPTNWTARGPGPTGGSFLPEIGTECVVLFDHLGDGWVSAWTFKQPLYPSDGPYPSDDLYPSA